MEKDTELNTVQVNINDLIGAEYNPRQLTGEQFQHISDSLQRFGFVDPIIVNSHKDRKNIIIGGHQRCKVAKELGYTAVPVVYLELPLEKERELNIRLNKNSGEWDWDALANNFEMDELKEWGFTDEDLGDWKNDEDGEGGTAGQMSVDFGVPPFSVLDTRKEEWLTRKRAWHAKINDQGESRENLLDEGGAVSTINSGVSILDPVLAELLVKWFGMAGGKVIDPFAGDTVFGFVAASSGMQFEGIELRQEQAELNQKRCDEAELDGKYYCDTSENIDEHIPDASADLVFSCPPYADLEVYSDNPKDLSTMPHDKFFELLTGILGSTYRKLKDNRFACIVMGEVRNKKGGYIGTVPKVIQAMESAGYVYYNEIILVNSAGTLPMRAGKYMRAGRKIGKMHQNVLIFLKGSAKKAVADLGDIQAMAEENDAD
jgi:DNA modification methylase